MYIDDSENSRKFKSFDHQAQFHWPEGLYIDDSENLDNQAMVIIHCPLELHYIVWDIIVYKGVSQQGNGTENIEKNVEFVRLQICGTELTCHPVYGTLQKTDFNGAFACQKISGDTVFLVWERDYPDSGSASFTHNQMSWQKDGFHRSRSFGIVYERFTDYGILSL